MTSLARETAAREYLVTDSDTVSTIAERFGVSTARVLVLNGLSWRSPVVAGQTLLLSTSSVPEAPRKPLAQKQADLVRYTIVAGDTISAIAASHALSTSAVLSANGLCPESIICPGQVLVLP